MQTGFPVRLSGFGHMRNSRLRLATNASRVLRPWGLVGAHKHPRDLAEPSEIADLDGSWPDFAISSLGTKKRKTGSKQTSSRCRFMPACGHESPSGLRQFQQFTILLLVPVAVIIESNWCPWQVLADLMRRKTPRLAPAYQSVKSASTATVSEIVLGFAPGYVACTATVGGTTSGYSLMGNRHIAINPMRKMIESTPAKTGRRMKKM
jgi:hypothetical protein